VAFYGFALKYRWADSAPGLAATGAAAGAMSAFIANMRTSYLPILVAFLGCFLIGQASLQSESTRRRAVLRACALTACFAIGYVALQAGLITRHLPSSYKAAHPLMHPLVLGLAVPSNDFSQAMGIRWADEVGPEKAQTIDPDAGFLGPRYDAALFRYYATLW